MMEKEFPVSLLLEDVISGAERSLQDHVHAKDYVELHDQVQVCRGRRRKN